MRQRAATTALALAAALCIPQCSSGGGADTDDGSDGFPGFPGTWAALRFPTGGPAPSPMVAVRAFPRLGFVQPTFLTWAPDGRNRVFVVERAGRIRVFANDDDAAASKLFLDIAPRVKTFNGEEGLLGLAFDPAYAANGFFYVNYTETAPDRSVISRFRVSADPDAADPASETVLLEVAQPAGNHNGGMLAFGPDGMLYLSFGDGGGGGDPWRNGQDKTTLLGKLLRIDPHSATPYAIPPDNPFVGEGGGVREEIWAYGLRNPWRFSFDRHNGELWLGDVGQNAREEIDFVVKGGNYGWNVYEGTWPFDNPNNLPPEAFERPVVDHGRAEAGSITGGYVYRGSALAELRGAYVYGDFVTGRIQALVANQGALVSNTQIATLPSISSFGEDEAGELYALSYGAGTIWRLERAGGGSAFPARLSATGIFADVHNLRAAPGVLEYGVASELWSDGARKRRWIVLPQSARIGFAAEEPWAFPQGTALIKHFEIDTTVGDPRTRRRLETRVLLREAGGWAGYTYRWNAQQTDADLLGAGAEETLTITDPVLGARTQRWVYPGRGDCMVCHTQAAGFVLGVGTRQLNHDERIAGAVRSQLDYWSAIGAFTAPIGSAEGQPSLPDPHGSAPLAERARSYLAANCANCHQPGGPTPNDIDLRHATAIEATRLLDVRPSGGDLGLLDAFRIKPGVKESSVLWERLRRLDGTRMPPLASHVVDERALALIGEWIDALR